MKVCAIIVTFNRKEWLLRCVKAVLAQSFKPSELIIVDNASTDGTSEYLAATGTINNSEITADAIVNVSNSDSNIKYFRLSNNQGGAGGFYWGHSFDTPQKPFFTIKRDDYCTDFQAFHSVLILSKMTSFEKLASCLVPLSIYLFRSSSLVSNNSMASFIDLSSPTGTKIPASP